MIYILTLLFFVLMTGAVVQAKDTPTAPVLAANCQPVEGNQPFFGGEAVFNTFYGRPVPLTFYIKGDKAKLKSAAILVSVPQAISVVGAFQSNHIVGDKAYNISYVPAKRNGKEYKIYRISGDLSYMLTKKYTPTWRCSKITIGFGAPKSFSDGKVYWAMENNHKKLDERSFIIKFHTPLKVPSMLSKYKFRIMPYSAAQDLAWHNKSLQKTAADLMLASGMTENVAFNRKSTHFGQFDQYLKKRGFSLMYHPPQFGNGSVNVAHWNHGKSPEESGIPGAMGPDGKRSKRWGAVIPALQNKKFVALYENKVKEAFQEAVKSKYAIIDYEPWAWPEKMGFSPRMQAEFRKAFSIKRTLTPEMILGKYRKQWTMFWIGLSNRLIKEMVDAARKAQPGIKIISYTYLRDYDTKKNKWELFKSCPKDPRQEAQIVDELMFSTYRINGKKFVDALRTSKRYIHGTDISIIALLQRANKLASWVKPEFALSPQQIYQKAVLSAAMGIKRFALWPGRNIDGAFYISLGKAARLIWAHEKFYYGGKNIHSQVTVAPRGKANSRDFAYTAQEAGGKQLITLFNFTPHPLDLAVTLTGTAHTGRYQVAPYGVKLVEL